MARKPHLEESQTAKSDTPNARDEPRQDRRPNRRRQVAPRAGVNRGQAPSRRDRCPVPRSGGDAPRRAPAPRPPAPVAPRARGWNPSVKTLCVESQGRPARAGMKQRFDSDVQSLPQGAPRTGVNQSAGSRSARPERTPRTRGDEPPTANRSGKRRTVQPRARGETKSEGGIHASNSHDRRAAHPDVMKRDRLRPPKPPTFRCRRACRAILKGRKRDSRRSSYRGGGRPLSPSSN